MSELIDFIKANYINIGIIVVSVLCLLVVIEVKDIDLNPPKPESKLVQQVTVETFEDINLNSYDNFCDSYLGNSLELEGACNQLTETNCNKTKCCVYGNNKCVAGDSNGPTYKTDKNGKLITMDSFYYMGNKHTI